MHDASGTLLSPWMYPVLFLTGGVAGFVDSIAGGGGLITLPVLLNLGLAPQPALGTNKLQSTFGSSSAAWHYRRAGLVSFRECGMGAGLTFVGALAGTLAVQRLDPALLRQAIPWLLAAIAIYLLFQPALGDHERQPRLRPRLFYAVAGLALGFYDGFFGPGTGTFWALAFVGGLGFALTRATAHTKVMNFASNAASLAVFLMSGEVWWGAGLCMGVGQWLGARLGSHLAVRRGTRFIRSVFIGIVLALTAKLMWQNLAR